mmetsp:Transcript_89862/g.254646  ORF Transcript_89862/g.254646 Transcript_89862/m.254646 type:complete len:323 (+) Transcript_89862:289-1257(+)
MVRRGIRLERAVDLVELALLLLGVEVLAAGGREVRREGLRAGQRDARALEDARHAPRERVLEDLAPLLLHRPSPVLQEQRRGVRVPRVHGRMQRALPLHAPLPRDGGALEEPVEQLHLPALRGHVHGPHRPPGQLGQPRSQPLPPDPLAELQELEGRAEAVLEGRPVHGVHEAGPAARPKLVRVDVPERRALEHQRLDLRRAVALDGRHQRVPQPVAVAGPRRAQRAAVPRHVRRLAVVVPVALQAPHVRGHLLAVPGRQRGLAAAVEEPPRGLLPRLGRIPRRALRQGGRPGEGPGEGLLVAPGAGGPARPGGVPRAQERR